MEDDNTLSKMKENRKLIFKKNIVLYFIISLLFAFFYVLSHKELMKISISLRILAGIIAFTLNIFTCYYSSSLPDIFYSLFTPIKNYLFKDKVFSKLEQTFIFTVFMFLSEYLINLLFYEYFKNEDVLFIFLSICNFFVCCTTMKKIFN